MAIPESWSPLLKAAARKLRDRGIEPTEQRLAAFAAHAARNGKPLDDVVEAVLDAAVGENERLKSFGIAYTISDKPFGLASFRYAGRTVEAELPYSGPIVDALTKLMGSS